MNVQLAVHRFFPESVGGTELYALQLAKGLAQAGHGVSVLSGTRPGDCLEPQGSFDGIPITRLAFPAGPANPIRDEYDNPVTARRLRALWCYTRPDVLHICHPGNLSTSILAVAGELGIPTVVTLTDFWPICPVSTLCRSDGELCSGPCDLGLCARCYVTMGERGTRYRPIVMCVPPAVMRIAVAASRALALQRPSQLAWLRAMALRTSMIRRRILAAGAVLCLSEFQRQLLARWEYPLAYLRRVPHGTATARIAGAHRERSRNIGVRFGYIGPLAEHKGAHLPIEAFARLKADMPVSLTYWGPIPAQPDRYASRVLALLSATPNVAHRGTFAPDHLPAVMSDLEVLIVPSMWYENTPTVIYEALAHRVPVIATGIGGMQELVLEHRGGWLFPRADVAKLAALMQAQVSNPLLVSEAAERIGQVPEFRAHAHVVEELYLRLVGARHGVTEHV